jgi:hypothetical protein
VGLNVYVGELEVHQGDQGLKQTQYYDTAVTGWYKKGQVSVTIASREISPGSCHCLGDTACVTTPSTGMKAGPGRSRAVRRKEVRMQNAGSWCQCLQLYQLTSQPSSSSSER